MKSTIVNTHNTAFGYRPEIDGLRGIAVLSVFVFHLNRNWLPGGFVGVDIFFVLSGYLITSIIYNDLNKEKFSLLRFYQRRIARIFPALFAVALVTLVGAAFVYSSQDLASAGANLTAATLSLANIKYMLQGSYFTISPDAQPFLHYWSLSVEEQFYMFFPLLLLLLYRYARHRLSLFLSIIGILSLIFCVLLTQFKPAWAFYLLPTRAWELLAGCLLAVTPFVSADGRSVIFPRWIPVAGLLLLAGSFMFIHEGPQFPGWQAFFPVIGTVALILPGANLDSWVGKFLSSKPMINVGKVSFSLYLWHWPVFSFIDYNFYLWSFESRFILKIILTLLLTVATFLFIENPARIFLNQATKRRFAYGVFFILMILFTYAGVSVRQEFYVNAEFSDVAKGGLVFAAEPNAPSVVLMGDSNGSMYGRLMKRICADLGYNLTVISVAAGDPLPPKDGQSGQFWFDSLEAVRKAKPDFLVIAMAWSGKLKDDPERLAIAVKQLKKYADNIILLNQPPIPPEIASRKSIRSGARPPFNEDDELRSSRVKANAYLQTLISSNVSVLDVSRHFETEDGEVIFVDNNGLQLYQDATHLSDNGAKRLKGALIEAFDRQ